MSPSPSRTASFDQLAATVPATIGIAIAAPGRAEVLLGRWSTGVAWSTMKVPLAIAALRSDRSRAQHLVVKAITESDNPASEALWSQLGEPAEAARHVQAVLKESGDDTTMLESRRLRQGYTAFGQTLWALRDQARFAARLSAIPDGATVIDLMRQLVDDHRWGLAAKAFAAKGGWGPGVHGDYLVRQFGMIPTEFGDLGIALAAETSAFETGVAVLDTMTNWLVSHLPELTEQ